MAETGLIQSHSNGRLAASSGDERGVGTMAKGFALLEAVASADGPVRFVDLLNSQPYPKATLHRLLRTLVDADMLAYDEQRQTYHLGLRLMRLAHASWTQSGIADAAREVLDALVAELDMTVHLAVLDNAQVLYVDKRTPARPVTMFSSAGKVGPAYCTGVGKAMLAFLSDERRDDILNQQSFYRYTEHSITSADTLREELETIRREGHAFDRQEHEPDIICVAAPIISDRGNVLGAISVTTTIHSSSLKKLEKLAPRIRQAAAEIAHQASMRMIPGA